MADWAHLALTVGDIHHPDYQGPPTRDDLNYMWDTYIAGEFGGANEVYAEVAAITGDAKHLETARCFDNRESLFQACVENRDILVCAPGTQPGRRRPPRLHANQHVPNFTGYLRIFEQTGDAQYHVAAKNFWGMLVPHRMFSHGGAGGNYPGSNNNIEQLQNRDNIANAIAEGGAETCTTYNVMKLARNLFFHDPDPKYMDYVERGLFNQIAGSRADTTSTSNPQVTYFQPLTPGNRRGYGNTGTCCGGTGMENHTKHQESVYSHSDDALWVNQFISSTLTWAERGFEIVQETDFPRTQTTKLTINGRGQLAIKLRVPAWATNGFFVEINGRIEQVRDTPGTYVQLRRRWVPGDTIEITMPFSLRIERARDRPDTQSVFWGPLLLPILGSPGAAGSYRELTLYRHLKRDGDYSRAAITPAGGQTFTSQGLTLRPHYVGDTQPHSPYFRRVEPEIVFGALDDRRAQPQAQRRAAELRRPGHRDPVTRDGRPDVPRHRVGPGAVQEPRHVRVDGRADRLRVRAGRARSRRASATRSSRSPRAPTGSCVPELHRLRAVGAGRPPGSSRVLRARARGGRAGPAARPGDRRAPVDRRPPPGRAGRSDASRPRPSTRRMRRRRGARSSASARAS